MISPNSKSYVAIEDNTLQPSSSYYPGNLILRKGTPFEAMTGRIAPSSEGLLAEGFWGFPQL